MEYVSPRVYELMRTLRWALLCLSIVLAARALAETYTNPIRYQVEMMEKARKEMQECQKTEKL